MEYVLLFVEDFTDGGVYPKRIKRGELIRANQSLKDRFEQSHPGCFEVQQKLPPQLRFKCKHCDKIYKNEYTLNKHIKTHEKD